VGANLPTIPTFRKGFADGFNKNRTTGEFLFVKDVMGVQSRPIGTPYEASSFAYRHNNVLFISVDAFRLVGDGTKNYIDRANGFGGEGAITCDVSGDHLTWLEDVLAAGRTDETIKHIFVQAHLPIIQPVRKVICSVRQHKCSAICLFSNHVRLTFILNL
jgi:hypothetical protein